MERKRRFSRRISRKSSNKRVCTDASIALLQPPIIRNVLRHLPPIDVYRFGQAFSEWYGEAIQVLKECPLVDDCYLDGKDMRSKFEALREKKHEVIESQAFKKLSHDNWFFWRASTFHPSVDPDAKKYIKGFFERDMRCIPSFSLITFNRFYDVVKSISPKHSTVFINLCRRIELNVMEDFELETFEALDRHFETPRLFESLPDDDLLHERYIEGFHLNRFTSDHKVIITDWSDPESPRPTTNDPSFPIKSLIILSNKAHTYSSYEYTKAFEHLVSSSSCDISGGMVCHSDFWYHDPRFKGFSKSNCISIAFAGRDIVSALLKIKKPDFNREGIDRKACDFKNELENQCFPINDGRVLGFYFEETFCSYACASASEDLDFGFRTFSRTFPLIKFFRIQIYTSHGFIFEPPEREDNYDDEDYDDDYWDEEDSIEKRIEPVHVHLIRF